MATTMKSNRGMGQPKKKKMKDMSVDEFFSAGIESDSESSTKSSETSLRQSVEKVKTSKLQPKSSPKIKGSKKVLANGKDQKNKGMIKNKNVKVDKNEKTSLARTLKDNDPEFYEYLKGEDENLLNNLEDLSDEDDDSEQDPMEDKNGSVKHPQSLKPFERDILNLSDSDDDDDDEDQGDDAEGGSKGYIHKLPDKLEVASDDSGTESEGDEDDDARTTQDGIILTNKLLAQWAKQMSSLPSPKVLREIVSAFHGAVYEAGGKSDDSLQTKYKVKGSTAFNGIVRLCLLHVAPALQSILRVSDLSNLHTVTGKNKKWKKIKPDVKSYISALLQLLTQLSEPVMVNAILKHIHKLVTFYASFPKLSRSLMKQMIKMWTTGEETSRVLAFLCINKLIHLKREPFLEIAVKKLYMAYVSNCKFVSPTALPLINFMQHSLVEVLSNDFTMAYQYAFVYIRQLAIHLRNAISVKKKNMFQIVYNWQYIHCLGLWTQLLSSYPNDTLKPLIYPLTQTIIGTIKLVPTPRYYPLRFHCVKLLNMLSSKTNIYIPTLPFLLDIFEQTDFNKRHQSVSLKPFNFAVILKFSKPQLLEKVFKDGLIDQLYEQLLESYNIQAHSVGFPELIIPSLIQLRDFKKKCKIANYCKQLKQIIDKIEEQSKFIIERRKKSTLRLDDFQGIQQWEQRIETSPLRKFYISWRKLRDRELQHEISRKEEISGAAIDIPSIKYKKLIKATPEERESLSKLFEDESDSDNETRFLLKEERPEKTNKKRKKAEESGSDGDYSDFDDDELEQLAKSASEDESEEEDENLSNDEDEEDIEIDDDSEENIEIDESEDDDNEVDENDESDKKSSNVVKSRAAKAKKIQTNVNVSEDVDDVVEDFVLSGSESD